MSLVTVCRTSFRERPAIHLANENVSVVVLLGGGHIASITRRDGADPVSPLWTPPWSSLDPGVRKLAPKAEFRGNDAQQLSCITGHSLILDVFAVDQTPALAKDDAGSHQSPGMLTRGRAALSSWEVAEVAHTDAKCCVTLAVDLGADGLRVSRVFELCEGESVVRVRETVVNTEDVRKSIGRAQQVSFGPEFIGEGCLFSCNADAGKTAQSARAGFTSVWSPDTLFQYPFIPRRDGNIDDWRIFPRSRVGMESCSMRINPEHEVGWLVAAQPKLKLGLLYAWDRERFPWVVTMEENNARSDPPWSSKTMVRSISFASSPFSASENQNEIIGKTLEIPVVEYLNPSESSSTEFYLGLDRLSSVKTLQELSPANLPNLFLGSPVPTPLIG